MRLKDTEGASVSDPLEAEDPNYRDPTKADVEPIGPNSKADVERAFASADELFPLEGVRTMCRQWLTEHKSARVIAAMVDAKRNASGPVSRYVQAILDSPEKARANGRPPGKPEPPARRLPMLSETDPEGLADYKARRQAALDKGPKP